MSAKAAAATNGALSGLLGGYASSSSAGGAAESKADGRVAKKKVNGDKSTDVERPSKKPRTANGGGESTTSSSALPSGSGRDNKSTSNGGTTTATGNTATPMDAKTIQRLACKGCIFCRMPRCERCHACVFTAEEEEVNGGHCLRKMCCTIPLELKLQPAADLGFPPQWTFAFDDPQKTSLAWGTKRIFSLAGLRIVAPGGEMFHSLAAALADLPHASVKDATGIVEKFLVHVGSSRYASTPRHFLVGKNYCLEFTNGRGRNVVLFGKVAACLSPAGTSEKEKSYFVVEYDKDALAIAKRMGTEAIPSVQLVDLEAAWGGCIAFERRIQCRRGPRSAIQNIDQATAAETWVAPDMRSEEMVEQPDGTSLPQLTVLARGYKFIFRTKSSAHNGKKHYGVFASCTQMHASLDQELNLKPGELIDLGVFSPLRKEDQKALPAFIIKNYMHSLKIGRWGVVAGLDNVVYDLTDDRTGQLHDDAARRTLSYTRKQPKGQYPTLHARLDPSGNVHFLFGIRYEGSWSDYEKGMQQLVPLFSKGEVEVTLSRHHGLGKRASADSKYLQSIGMFQMQDILACRSQLECMFGSEVDDHPPAFVDRAKQVVQCLEKRTEQLLKIFDDAKGANIDGPDATPLNSTLEYLRKLQADWKG